ncbi:MAG TPA: peptidoglycan-binding domain-containing protein [Terriglobia bacterium]|nr:peptidoglycan-binding domain-containing protein [Terriglobia bacterium]
MMRLFASRQRRIQWALSIAVAVSFIPGLRLIAGQKNKAHIVHRRTRRPTATRRYRHVRIQPERVREIQEALVKAGFLHDKPDGVWGSSTREAMKQYQKQNGFTPTGLPEAKPLMLLGLGPHPLPPGLGPLPPAAPEADSGSRSSTETSEASASPTVKKPTSSN